MVFKDAQAIEIVNAFDMDENKSDKLHAYFKRKIKTIQFRNIFIVNEKFIPKVNWR